MKVHEVKRLVPLSDIYVLRKDVKYIILVPATAASHKTLHAMLKALKRADIDAIISVVQDTKDFRIFDVESLP